MAAYAAEPPEVAALASTPCMVVAPSNALSACHIAVEGTVAELSLYSDGTTVEPPEEAASSAEPLEVSVVPTYELSSCSVPAKEAVCELSACPVTAMEVICELHVCPITAMEAVCELPVCPVTATETAYKLLSCSEPAMEANYELLSCPDPAKEAASELSALSVTSEDAVCEFPDCFAAATRAVQELCNLKLTFCVPC